MANRLFRAVDRILGGRLSSEFRGAATADDDDPKASEYRRLTDIKRDLMPLTYDRQRELSFYLWQRNPLARGIIDTITQFCAGDEFSIEVKILKRDKDGNETDTGRNDAQMVWDDFASDPINNFNQNFPDLVEYLLITGELVVPVFSTAKANPDGTMRGQGDVRIGFIDSSAVREVITNPLNLLEVKAVRLAPLQGETEGKLLTVVAEDINPESPTYERRVGEVVFWRNNKLLNQTRGTGILIEMLDWLDVLDQFVFDALRGFQARNMWFMDVTMKGLNEEQIKEKQKTFAPPQTGAARLHNENVVYETSAPKLGSLDVDTAVLAMQRFIVGAKRFPMTWFGTGEDANKASAESMSLPTLKMLKSIQARVKEFVKFLALYVVDQAIIGKKITLADNERIDVAISMYDFERRDAAVMGAGMQQVTSSLVLATQNGWASDESAKKVVDGLLQRMGVEVSAEETVEDLKAERAARATDALVNVYDKAGVPPGGAPKVPITDGVGGNGNG
jgi:hypothetical protein